MVSIKLYNEELEEAAEAAKAMLSTSVADPSNVETIHEAKDIATRYTLCRVLAMLTLSAWWSGAAAAETFFVRLRAMQAAERELGVTLLMLEVRTPSEHENAFAALAQMGADAIIDILGAADRSNSATTGRVVQLALKHRLPAVYQSEDLVVEGGLMSYGPRLADEFRRAATYVNKILKGVKPADLPVEQPTRFYLAINLKAAAAIGIALPTSTLLRADEVIE